MSCVESPSETKCEWICKVLQWWASLDCFGGLFATSQDICAHTMHFSLCTQLQEWQSQLLLVVGTFHKSRNWPFCFSTFVSDKTTAVSAVIFFTIKDWSNLGGDQFESFWNFWTFLAFLCCNFTSLSALLKVQASKRIGKWWIQQPTICLKPSLILPPPGSNAASRLIVCITNKFSLLAHTNDFCKCW